MIRKKKYKRRIDLVSDDAVISQQQVQPTNQRATCRVTALLPANQNQAFLNEVDKWIERRVPTFVEDVGTLPSWQLLEILLGLSLVWLLITRAWMAYPIPKQCHG